MAKRDKDAAFKEFLADLQSINPAFEDLLKDEKVSAKLKEGVLARSDYSSQMDSLRAERENFANEVAEARQKIEGWQKWYGDTSREVASTHDKLKQYEELYGALEADGNNRRAATRMGVSKDELETMLAERERQRDIAALKIADDLSDIKIDFDRRFKETLDTTDVYRIAGERQVDLKTAYNIHIADRVKEQETEALKVQIKREREEAVAEYAAAHKLPVLDNRTDMTHVLDVKDTPNTPQGRVAAALVNFGKR